MIKFRPWTILVILAAMMLLAYVAIFRAAKLADTREVPLAKTPARP